MELRDELDQAREATKPLPKDPRAALGEVMSRLVRTASSVSVTPAEADAMAGALSEALAWSAFFPSRANDADAFLVHTLDEWPGLGTVASPDAGARTSELTDAVLALEPSLQAWLGQVQGAPAVWPADEIATVNRRLDSEVRAVLSDPRTDAISRLQPDLEALFLVAGASMPAGFARRVLARAIEQVAATVEASLEERAASILPVAESTARRIQATQVLTAWIGRRFEASASTSAELVDRMSDPADLGQPIARAFIDETGAVSSRLAHSQVSARYFALSSGVPSGDALMERAESTFVFDWSARPPVAALQDRPFAAELAVRVPSAQLALPIAVVVEADGELDVAIEDSAGARTVLHEVPGDQVRRFDVPISATADAEVTLRVRYTTPAAGGARSLKLLTRSSDGLHDELPWAALGPVVQRLHRGALALRDVAFSPAIEIDLDGLAAGASLREWLAFFALSDLIARLHSPAAAPVLAAFLSGAETSRAELVEVLNVETEELHGALQLLGVPDTRADRVVLPTSAGVEQIRAVLELVDEARRYHLPSTALARWTGAGPHEIYEWALAALRVGLAPSDWLKVLAEVHDPVRKHLRDAQLDLLISRDRIGTAGDADLSSREAISDHLLTDVQMSACMTTSRIQFAYSAVQRYVDAGQAGRAPWLLTGLQEERFAREWVSLRQYRLHEAQMRILVHAENWIDPAIRPTKTPAFERLEQTMSSGPLTLHLAEKAVKEYAAALAEVARLEPVAMVTHEKDNTDRPLAFRDSELYGTHVFARTRAHPQRLYYRRRLPDPDRRWTPWERIDADLEGTHYLAVVVFGRLRLICADFSVARSARPDGCAADTPGSSYTSAGREAITDYEGTLSWIDREHGRWSPVRRGGRFPFPITLSNPPPGEYLFGTALPDQFATFERPFTIDRISVRALFGRDGMDTGSKMRVLLRNDSSDQEIGHIEGPVAANSAGDVMLDRIPAGVALDELSRLRTEWRDSGRDDWDVMSLRVSYWSNGTVVHSAALREGKRAQLYTYRDYSENTPGEVWESEALTTRFTGGWQVGDGDPETSWQVFEGPLSPPLALDVVQPSENFFRSEYEVIPQGLDLSRAIAIEAVATGPESFELRIYTVPHTENARVRARFQVKPETVTAIPEVAEKWGTEWVNGGEFCYPIETEQRIRAALRIFADDTIVELHPVPLTTMGAHQGTRAVGQELLSAGGGDRAPAPVYGDGVRLATATLPYDLTVERTTRLSAAISPKILDEEHGSKEPARTFFIERQPEWLADDTKEDPPLVIERIPPAEWKPVGDGAIDPFPTLNFRAQVAYFPQGNTSGTHLMTLLAQSSSTSESDLVAIEHWPQAVEVDLQANAKTTRNHLWRFQTFWHPQAVGFRRILESRGLPRMVRVENQELAAGTDLPELARVPRVDHFSTYTPSPEYVDPRWPLDDVDFTIEGPFSEYNWELFFDSLLYIAQRFDEEGQHDEADEMFALLVDRTRVAQAGVWDEPSLYQTAPIRAAMKLELERMGPGGLIDRDRLREDIVAQIERIRANPYQPHLIARGWPTVYARALQIRFAEHLIRAGEADFRRAYAGDNRTYLDSASARFELAARVLGPTEDSLAEALHDELGCFASLIHGTADTPAEGIAVLEPYLPAELLGDGTSDEALVGSARWHFCVPRNEKLNELRAVIADRLLKLRSCQDIDGVRRALSLYGRQIDPALLVRATADGLDLDVLLGRISSAKPSLYFQALWQRALQACERARSLEDAWLSAQERADSEELARLQNDQEIRAMEAQAEVMSQRLDDARKLEEALQRAIESAEIRRDFYASRKRLNAQEEAEGRSLVEAGKADTRAADDSRAASDWAWIPTVEIYGDVGVQTFVPPAQPFYARAGVSVRYRLGGETGVQVYRANAEGHNHDAAAARVEAGTMGRQGSFQRRADEWKLQESLALKDLQRGEHDRAGAEIRVRIAELEHDLHRQRIDDVRSVRTFLRDKLTSRELHAWRADRMRQLRYQQHQVAYELVSQAKAALVREHGLEEQGFVADPWDPSRHGTAAAAGLLHELEKQQQLYLETWRREQQKLKIFSLVERDPLAFLELLQTGEAVFSIDEADYDEDGAGDYFRRVRHISLDIPAVRGPYTNVNARLTQLRGEVRIRAHQAADGAYRREAPNDPRFRDDLANGEFIVTNTGLQDDGRIDQGQDGENPPPFAMNGAISSFRIELPPEQNHFDRQTISDVIVRVGLTSRHGGEGAAETAVAARRQLLEEQPQPVMLALHSAFSNAWHRFVDELAQTGTGELALTLDGSHIPLRLQPIGRIVTSSLYFTLPEGESLQIFGGDAIGTFSTPPELQPARRSTPDPHIPVPMHRLQLREPMRPGEERRVRIQRRTGTTTPKRGWLICWLEGVGEPR
ncbi:MAG: neuraminidase-like domain-containing protein [Kofleriaceae bacterium]